MVSGFLNSQYQRFYTENNITLFREWVYSIEVSDHREADD